MKNNSTELQKVYKNIDKKGFYETRKMFSNYKLDVECEKIDCPNRFECYEAKTAAINLQAHFSNNNVNNLKSDEIEPYKIAEAMSKISQKYIILTCQNADEFIDESTKKLTETMKWIKALVPSCVIEVQIPDIEKSDEFLGVVIKAAPDIISHNIETVNRLFEVYKTESDYYQSLEILRKAKLNGFVVKSGLKVGLGEQQQELINAMQDIRSCGCDILTIGQYFQSDPEYFDVKRFYRIQEFSFLDQLGLSMNFNAVVATPFATMSYKAQEAYLQSMENNLARQA